VDLNFDEAPQVEPAKLNSVTSTVSWGPIECEDTSEGVMIGISAGQRELILLGGYISLTYTSASDALPTSLFVNSEFLQIDETGVDLKIVKS